MGQKKAKKTGERSQYSAEFKAKAVATWEKMRAEGRTAPEIAHVVGCPPSVLYYWVKQAKAEESGAKPPKMKTVPIAKRAAPSRRALVTSPDVERMQREIDLLREEREHLKKTIEIFARRQS